MKEVGGGAGGWAKGGWHFVMSRRLSEQSGMADAGAPLLNLLGVSCSICLLMSTVVGGTHVCHVTGRAGGTFT